MEPMAMNALATSARRSARYRRSQEVDLGGKERLRPLEADAVLRDVLAVWHMLGLFELSLGYERTMTDSRFSVGCSLFAKSGPSFSGS